MYKDRIQLLREENNVKQKELANLLNIKRGRYSMYETEKDIFPIKHLNKVCEFFNVSLDFIFGFTDIRNYDSNTNEIDLKLSGARIRGFRKKRGLTMEKLGESLNCSYGTIAGYERGRYIFATPLLYDFCRKYKVSADYILGKTRKEL